MICGCLRHLRTKTSEQVARVGLHKADEVTGQNGNRLGREVKSSDERSPRGRKFAFNPYGHPHLGKRGGTA